MTPRKPTTAAALAGIITAGLASADVPIAVFHDATYSLSESCGIPCSGVGAEPVGTACPKAGDVATTDCQPYLLSYNGAVCVAPVDAECVLIHDDVWGCEFPKTGYTSAVEAETIAAYDGQSSGWGTGTDEGVQVGDEEEETPAVVNYDTAVDTPLGVNCEVATETTTQGHTTEGGQYYASTGSTPSAGPGGKSTDYGTPSTGTDTGDYGTTTHYGSTTTEGGVTGGGYGPIDRTPHVDYSTGTTDTTEGGTATGDYGTTGTTTESGTTTGSYTTGTAPETPEDGESTGDYTTGTTDYGTTEESPDKTAVDYQTGTTEGTEGQQTTVNYGTPSEGGEQDYTPHTGTDEPCDETEAPTETATYTPTEETTYAPTETTYAPTEETTYAPTEEATYAPTEETTYAPTEETTYAPTEETTYAPTEETTYAPTEETTYAPTEETTYAPTEETTYAPTEETTYAPTAATT
ncbi:hypothetical protein C6341_g23222, partial [Phytophthora cactorum]